MSLHIAMPRIRVRRPTFAEIRVVGRFLTCASTPPVVLLAEAVGFLWPALIAVAAFGGVQAGRIRGAAVERARHIRAMEGLQEVAHQLQLQNARYADEQRFWWNAGREPIHVNAPYESSGAKVSNERSR